VFIKGGSMSATLVREIPEGLVLKSGSHTSFENGVCAMELASWLAGEPWSFQPQCVCPVINAFMVAWNDRIRDDERRTRLLLPIIPKVIGTRSSSEVELARSLLCADWIVREALPAWLEHVPALAEQLAVFTNAKPIQSWDDWRAMLAPMRTARNEARKVRNKAWDEFWEKKRVEAAVVAVEVAAVVAAVVAEVAAVVVVEVEVAAAAAVVVEVAAIRKAAKEKLAPTTERLERSAIDLVERMIALK
jgi:hypothetical protein